MLMTLQIFLLGSPRAERDGVLVEGVRGRKAWALLAYLLLSPDRVDRRRLATALFPDAEDPGAALRWNLSQLRRGLGMSLEGDPVRVDLPRDTVVDVELIARGEIGEAIALPSLGRELLEGVVLDELELFTSWLDGERRHMASLTGDVLREAAVRSLSVGDARGAVVLAERVVELDPYDENAAVLLIRSLREAGRSGEAVAVAESTAVRLRVELGVEPSSMLWSAAHASTGGAARIGGSAAVEAQLEAGVAALAAGVPDAGLDALRGAMGGARAIGDPSLLARCLTSLGSGLIHAVRGSDQDGLTLLHEAVPLALAAELPLIAARASRELGYAGPVAWPLRTCATLVRRSHDARSLR